LILILKLLLDYYLIIELFKIDLGVNFVLFYKLSYYFNKIDSFELQIYVVTDELYLYKIGSDNILWIDLHY
jgi:hypothetical protein